MFKNGILIFKKMCYSINRIGRYIFKGVFKMKKGDKIDVFSVANFFLNIVDRDSGSTITPLKLQKILYYAQGYYLAINGKELFNEDFQAWAHGPANPEIYDKYKKYGFNVIDSPTKDEIPLFDNELVDFLYSIWETFGIYDGKYLENMTHQEKPWIEARNGFQPGEMCTKIISKKSMRDFFKLKLNEE